MTDNPNIPTEGQHRLAKAFGDAPPSRERSERRRRQLAEQLRPGPGLDGLRHLQAEVDAGRATASPSQLIALGFLAEAEGDDDTTPTAA